MTRTRIAASKRARQSWQLGGTDVRASLAALLVAPLLAGCMMGRITCGRPVDAPGAFRFEAKDAADTANIEWWKQFGDPVLDQLIAEALANNLSVKVAAANVEQAARRDRRRRARRCSRRLGYSAPAADAHTAESGATPEIAQTHPNPQTVLPGAAQASWEIDLWGRIRRLSESAQRQPARDRRGAPRRDPHRSSRRWRRNYLTLRGLDEQLVISKQTLDTYARIGAPLSRCSSSTARSRR